MNTDRSIQRRCRARALRHVRFWPQSHPAGRKVNRGGLNRRSRTSAAFHCCASSAAYSCLFVRCLPPPPSESIKVHNLPTDRGQRESMGINQATACICYLCWNCCQSCYLKKTKNPHQAFTKGEHGFYQSVSRAAWWETQSMLKHISPTEQAVLGEWGHFFLLSWLWKENTDPSALCGSFIRRSPLFSAVLVTLWLFFYVHVLVFSTFSNNLQTNHCS